MGQKAGVSLHLNANGVSGLIFYLMVHKVITALYMVKLRTVKS